MIVDLDDPARVWMGARKSQDIFCRFRYATITSTKPFEFSKSAFNGRAFSAK
jgi:hypothetical protein